MMKVLSILLLVVVVFSGCETTLNETQTGALTGTAIGAGLGAIIGNQSGHAGAGTAIGAGAGALAGGLMGEGIRRSKNQNQQAPVYQQPAQQTYQQPQVIDVHTKFCPTCGRTYSEGIAYCAADGTQLRYTE